MFDGNCRYYVFDDDGHPYPIWYPASLFRVEDPELPADWMFGYVEKEPEKPGYPLISFSEWALDRFFYERLVDGDEDARRAFEAHRPSAEARGDA